MAGKLIITDADGKVVEQSEIEAAGVSGALEGERRPMKVDGQTQWHRAFQSDKKK